MKNERRIETPYSALTLEEAVYLLNAHEGEGWFDADKQVLVLVE